MKFHKRPKDLVTATEVTLVAVALVLVALVAVALVGSSYNAFC